MSQRIEVTAENFSKLLILVAVVTFIYLIRDIVLLLFLAVIISSALQPIVDLLEKESVPRWLAVLFIFFSTFFLLGIFIGKIIPPLIFQGQSLLNSLPVFIQESLATLHLNGFVTQQQVRLFMQEIVGGVSGSLVGAPLSLIRFGAGLVGHLATLATLLVFSFYFILERERVYGFVLSFFKGGQKREMEKILLRIEKKMGQWLRGQVVLMFLIGVFTYLGLLALRVDFALPLALLAGLLEIIPILGPLISVVPALVVAAAISPLKALSVATFYLLLQQLEGNILVPRVMKQAVGLDPVLVILALMVGARLAGPMGALISVPATAVLVIIYQEWRGESS